MPIDFEHANANFHKPKDMTDEQCQTLPAWRGNYPDGQSVIISCWKLSKEDIEEVLKTGVVWLHVVGGITPPVSIDTQNPFIQFDKN